MFIIKENTAADKVGEGTEEGVMKSITSYLQKQGFTIRNETDDTSFLKSKLQPEVDAMYKKHKDESDAAIKEATGVEKNANEKTSDYLKRATGGSTDKLKAVEKELNELKDKGVQGNELAEGYKKQLTDLQGNYEKVQTDHKEELAKMTSNIFAGKIQTQIDGAVAELRQSFDKKKVDDSVVNDVIASRVAKFHQENKAKDLEGVIVFEGTDGKVKSGTQDGKPLSAKEIVRELFTDIIDKNFKANGSGSGTGDGSGSGDGDGEKFEFPESVKTKVQAHDYLVNEKKMDTSTKEFNEAFVAAKDLPTR